MSIPIYLAFSFGEAPGEGASSCLPAQLGCRLSQEAPVLLAPEAPAGRDSLMLLSCETTPSYEPSPALAQAVAAYGRGSHTGLVCDWGMESAPFYESFAGLLAEACAGAFLPLWLPERFAEQAKEAWVLIGSDVVRGSFRRSMEETAARWPGRCVLSLRPLCARCPLPCSDGGEPLTEEGLRELLADTPAYWAEDLLCMYFGLQEGDGRSLVLYDTRDSLRWKLRAAEEAGFQAAIGRLEALRPLAET